jgi:tungstate transport system substrate-binding protein
MADSKAIPAKAVRGRAALVGAILVMGLLVGACGSSTSSPAASAAPSAAPSAAASAAPSVAASAEQPSVAPSPVGSRDLILATTTSTQDSGLLDVLVPAFEQETGYVVKTVAVGSGQAMKMGTSGDADVLLVHSPAAEKEFMATGNGADRQLVMHNTFLIVGPKNDPAGIRGMTSAADAMKKIADSGATFVSRGDGSGTEAKELAIWKKIGTKPQASAYIQTGQGMAPTLQVASEKGGYTLTDIATWAATKDSLDLEVDVQGDPALLNIYHVIRIDPAKWPKVNAAGAQAFEDYILSPAGQDLIGTFGVAQYGMPLFIADAGKSEDGLTWP